MTLRATPAMLAVTGIVDLVFDPGCPHVDEARALLRRALADAGFPVSWREWKRDAAETPAALRGLASPTILVDGIDVSSAEPITEPELGSACRVYRHGDKVRGVPPIDAVTRALFASARS